MKPQSLPTRAANYAVTVWKRAIICGRDRDMRCGTRYGLCGVLWMPANTEYLKGMDPNEAETYKNVLDNNRILSSKHKASSASMPHGYVAWKISSKSYSGSVRPDRHNITISLKARSLWGKEGDKSRLACCRVVRDRPRDIIWLSITGMPILLRSLT